jgi:hypothetical protein
VKELWALGGYSLGQLPGAEPDIVEDPRSCSELVGKLSVEGVYAS